MQEENNEIKSVDGVRQAGRRALGGRGAGIKGYRTKSGPPH